VEAVEAVEAVEEVIVYPKEKTAWIARNVERKARSFFGHKFWAQSPEELHRSAEPDHEEQGRLRAGLQCSDRG
jgi:hypothetical protein